METFFAKYKIKEGCLEEIKKWAQIMTERTNEVLATLDNEGVLIECAYLDKQGSNWYVIYFMKCDNIKSVFEILKKSKKDIDQIHKDILPKCLSHPPIFLKKLIDFENLN